MAVFDMFKRGGDVAPEAKASATGPVIAYSGSGRVAWSPRDSVSLTRSAFAGNPLIAPTVCEAMRSGEKSGQMAASLLTIADFMDEENDVVVRSLTSILEPVILIVMGLVVGFMAMSMFLPLFEMTAVGG